MIKKVPVILKGIATSWVHNVNSKTYFVFFNKVNYTQKSK
jgi:hypothetical protein